MEAIPQATGTGLWQTLWQALSLNGDFYENARHTAKNYRIAVTVAILAALSHALGSGIILLINLAPPRLMAVSLVIDILSVVGGCFFWALTIWLIGKWLNRNALNYGDLLVPIGFAYAPQALNFLTVIPLLGRPIELVLSVWSLLAVIVAVRQGLDISLNWATAICLVGWPVGQVAIGLIQFLEQRLVASL